MTKWGFATFDISEIRTSLMFKARELVFENVSDKTRNQVNIGRVVLDQIRDQIREPLMAIYYAP